MTTVGAPILLSANRPGLTMIRNPTRHQTLIAPHERSSTANSDPHTNPFPFLLFPFSHNNGGVSQQSDIFSPPHHLFYHIPSATSTSTLPHALYLAPFSPPSLAFLTLRFKSKLSPFTFQTSNLQFASTTSKLPSHTNPSRAASSSIAHTAWAIANGKQRCGPMWI